MTKTAFIACRNEDGKIKAIGLEHGDIAEVGPLLLQYYHRMPTIRVLLSLGELFTLGPEPYRVGVCAANYTVPNTVAFHRDRGEPMRAARLFRDEEMFWKAAKGTFRKQMVYLFKNDQWYFAPVRSPSQELHLDSLYEYLHPRPRPTE